MSLLYRLGFFIHLEKSDLAPTRQFTLALAEGKYTKLHSSAQHLLQPSAITCKGVQKLLGLTDFAAFAVPWAGLQFHSIQQDFSVTYKSHLHASRICPIPEAAAQDLWWVSLSSCSKPLSPPLASQSIATDATHSVW